MVRGGWADKRRAILAAALQVFSRDGYTRASIDAIAKLAGVSTRTIYNHFTDKAELFRTVIQDSAADVAAAQVAIIDRHLTALADLEPDLIEFGLAMAKPLTGHDEHFALVRQINADAGHLPPAALDAWWSTGPKRVRQGLARHLRRLADEGLLRVDDPDRAALHFLLLVQGAVPFHHGMHANREADIPEVVVSGVRAFLHGYGS